MTGGRKGYIGLLYIMPWMLGLLIFQLYPFISSFYYSLTDYNMVESPTFIGLDNYIHIFTEDKDFTQSLKVTFIYVLMAVPLKLAFALFIAMILNSKLRGINSSERSIICLQYWAAASRSLSSGASSSCKMAW